MNLAVLQLEYAVDGVERGAESEIDLRRGGIEMDDYLLCAQSGRKYESACGKRNDVRQDLERAIMRTVPASRDREFPRRPARRERLGPHESR